MSEFFVTINNKKHSVKISENGFVEINGKQISAELTVLNKNAFLLKYGNKVFEITSNQIENAHFGLLIEGWYFDTIVRTRLQETANELLEQKVKSKHRFEVHAPMPGLILKIKKGIGEPVKKGEPILILEAMKMENELRSHANGTVKEIFVKEGEPVEKNSILLTIE